MPYIDLEYLLGAITQQQLRELTSDDGREIDLAKVDEKLGDATDEAELYLRGRYALPLTSVPTPLKVLVRDIAVYRLHTLRPTATPQEVKDLYAQALKRLEGIGDGSFPLFEPPAGEVSETPNPIIATKTEEDRLVTPAVLDAAFPVSRSRDGARRWV